MVELTGQSCEPLLDAVNHDVGCRCAGGQTYGVVSGKPFRSQVIRGLDVPDSRTMDRASLDKLASVIAVGAADNDDYVTSLRQVHCSVLPLFGGLADRIHESHLGVWKRSSQQLDEMPYPLDGLSCLRHDPVARLFAQTHYVRLEENHVIVGEITSQAAHFYVVAFPNDDGMKAFGHKLRQRAMRNMNERACCFHYVQAAFARLAQSPFGCAMGGDHHVFCADIVRLLFDANSANT